MTKSFVGRNKGFSSDCEWISSKLLEIVVRTSRQGKRRKILRINICLPLNYVDLHERRNIIEVVGKYRDKLTWFIYSQVVFSSLLDVRFIKLIRGSPAALWRIVVLSASQKGFFVRVLKNPAKTLRAARKLFPINVSLSIVVDDAIIQTHSGRVTSS